MTTEELATREETLYVNIKNLIKGENTATVREVLKRIDNTLLNISFVK
ncbi:hypothetical protein [Tenacibaculum finnmarkense]|nr:hypothetical protein [Tenacibaculum finnmarkense]MCD8401445.1 hypothetical protein [Tenacibaculum finnmarkense genomovar ulcerans]